MRDHRTEFRVTTMSRVLKVHRSGFYAWLKNPNSQREVENLREDGEKCGVNRVARLMAEHGIRAQLALKKRRYRGGRPAYAVPNALGQQFDVEQPNTVWATDITHITTYEGWLHLAVVMDLCSRRRTYATRDAARADIFDYMEHFYNRKRRHAHLGHRSPVDYEAALRAG